MAESALSQENRGLRTLLTQTIAQNATELHLCPGAAPFMRIDGKLKKTGETPLTALEAKAIMDELLSLEVKKVLPREKNVTFTHAIDGIGRFRVTAYTQRGTTAATIRILPFALPTPSDVRFLPGIMDALSQSHGLILLCGTQEPTRATVMAAMIDWLNQNQTRHIMTIENPIEYLHTHNQSMVIQKEIGTDAPTVSEALASSLRESADVIFLGESPQSETMPRIIAVSEVALIVAVLNTPAAMSGSPQMLEALTKGDENAHKFITMAKGRIPGSFWGAISYKKSACGALDALLREM